jgi:hypothetical protein
MDQARSTVTDFTSTIEKMRVTRDNKVTDIQKFERQIQVSLNEIIGYIPPHQICF